MAMWEREQKRNFVALGLYEGLLRLTPGFPTVCQGSVHSVFHRVVNVQIQSEEDSRILALVSPEIPALPDSICLPASLLSTFQVGQALTIEGQRLSWQEYGRLAPARQPLQWKTQQAGGPTPA